jgi:autotransporter-associated beta strand protein
MVNALRHDNRGLRRRWRVKDRRSWAKTPWAVIKGMEPRQFLDASNGCIPVRGLRRFLSVVAAAVPLAGVVRATTDITGQLTADSGADNLALTGGAYTVTTTAGSTLDYSGMLSGTGTLEVTGTGTLDLQTISTFTLPTVGETVSGTYIGTAGYYNYEGYTGSGFIGALYTIVDGIGGQPDAPAVTIDAGATLQFGYNSDLKFGNSNSTSAPGNIANYADANVNIDNILDNGQLVIQGDNSDAIYTGAISGAGSVQVQTGLLYMYGENTFSGALICQNNMTLYLGTDHVAAAIPNAKVVFGNGSFILQTPYTTTETVNQNVYENHYGNDININGNSGPIILTGLYSYSDAGTTLAQQANPSLSNPALNYESLNGIASRRGINLEGGILQLGNGNSSNFFMPGNNVTTYLNLHSGGLLAFDYSNAAPTYMNLTIAGGGINQPYNAAGVGNVILHQGNIVVTAQQYYDGTTQIDSGANLQLGDGTTGDTTLNGSTFVSQTSEGDGNLLQNGQTISLGPDFGFGNGSSTSTGTSACVVIDKGSIVVDNVGATPLAYISGSGKFTQAGAGLTTLGPGIGLTGATVVAGGTLALATGALLANTSSVTISAAGRASLIASPFSSANTNFVTVAAPALDISQGGNQTIQNLLGDSTGSVYLGGNTLSVGSSASTTFGGVILDGGIGGGTGGALVKQGNGSLTLSNANGYSGGTTISAGTLVVANTTGSATGSGWVSVQAGAKLAGAGSISGALQTTAGAIIAPGSAAGTTLVVDGGATLGNSTIIDLSLAAPNLSGGMGGNELLSVAGGLSVGTAIQWHLTAETGFARGIYKLIDYTGSLQNPNGFVSWTFAGFPAGDTYAFLTGTDGSSDAIELDVTASPEPPTFGILGTAALLVFGRRHRFRWRSPRKVRP